MNKLFIDVGTNRFQGYDQIVPILGIDDTWHKIFIEPNPKFHSDSELMNRLYSIKNSKFYNCALDATSGKRKFTYLKDQSKDVIDQGGSLYLDFREQDAKYETVEINTLSFYDVIKDYIDGYEWYMKFDCENCEYECLEPIIEVYHEKIKWIACEFHGLTSPSESQIRIPQANKIIDAVNKYKISFIQWH